MSGTLSPFWRKSIYAVSYELIGIVVASFALLVMSDATPDQSLVVSVVGATVALMWSYAFNTLFEAWESRQARRGRSWGRRIAHALMFECGLVILLVPFLAWWLGVELVQALLYEAGLILLFMVYTFVFTWVFDRIFGLPQSSL